MRSGRTVLGALVLMLPISVEIPLSTDTLGVESIAARDGAPAPNSGAAGTASLRGPGISPAETRATLVGGMGRYALIDRGCEGQVLDTDPVRFREATVELEHRFAGGPTATLRGGTTRDEVEESSILPLYSYPYRDTVVVTKRTYDNAYVNPSVGFELENVGVGMGAILGRKPFFTGGGDAKMHPTFHLRIGSLDRVYLKGSYLENVPLYSGGGFSEIGLGVHPQRNWDLWFGVGGTPYDGAGLGVRVDYRVQPHWLLATRARLGHSGGESQQGVALGLTYSSRLAVEPPDPPKLPATQDEEEAAWMAWAWREPSKPRPRGPAREALPPYGKFQHVDSQPRVLSRTVPGLPDSAGSASGTVVVAALIDRDGKVRDTRIVKSTPGLDAAAVACVREWTFVPAMERGKSVAYWINVPVTFGPQ